MAARLSSTSVPDTFEQLEQNLALNHLGVVNAHNPDLIKCDLEGADLKVFLDACATLNLCRPLVFSEMRRKWSARFHYHPNDLIGFFAELGYGCFKINSAQLSPLESMIDDTKESNFFFLHRESHIPKARAAGLILD